MYSTFKESVQNGHVLTPRRFPYENSLAQFAKKKTRARANARRGLHFRLAFQLASLQVDDYSVYAGV